MAAIMAEINRYYALITEADSGLGLSIATRLVDDFLALYPQNQSLTLIMTSAFASKANKAVYNLRDHIAPLSPATKSRLTFINYTIDLTNIVSVSKAAKVLAKRYTRIDFVFLNTGIVKFERTDWTRLIKTTVMFWEWDLHSAYPTFKVQAKGSVSPQFTDDVKEDIGLVFCGNVMAHYYLVHELMGSIIVGEGRIIWTSALESNESSFDVNDIQGMKTVHAYESGMRLIDILVLTAESHSMNQHVSSWFAYPSALDDLADSDPDLVIRRPKVYVTHPGVCVTSVLTHSVADNVFILYWMTIIFHLVSWFGSSWHTVNTYTGAKAAVWLALADEEELEAKDATRSKWGSAIDSESGRVLLKETQVEGLEEEEWKSLGTECWCYMEELRQEWKKKLGDSEK